MPPPPDTSTTASFLAGAQADVEVSLRVISAGDQERVAACQNLYVDLDGTLIRTDLLWESLLSAVRQSPWILAVLPVWLLRGKVFLKTELAKRARLEPQTLPYREDLLSRIRHLRSSGARVVLATAAAEELANPIAAYLGVFDGVLATNLTSGNLKSQAKLNAILRDSAGRPFDYWGDSAADKVILAAAQPGLLVEPQAFRLTLLLRALRVHQWVKNLLLFLPIATAHRVLDPAALLAGFVSWGVFSLVASANYLANDLLDLSSDRRHPVKRFRPLASGQLSIPTALLWVAVLLASAAALTVAFTPPAFWPWLLVYFVLTNLYSLWLKQLLLVDLLVLSSLYTIRILAGGAVTGIAVSEWLLAFSMFLFTSLAFAKRYTELLQVSTAERQQLSGRAYQARDIDIVRVVGPVSGFMAILVMALYVNSPVTSTLYHRPQVLWLTCPLLAYWITRVWFLANRGDLHHDPIVFALKDANSYWTALCVAGVAIAASLP